MNRLDLVISFCLLVLACFIWLRDLTWASTLADTLPILIGIPLFYWAGQPWNFSKPLTVFPSSPLVITAILFLVGIVFNSTLLLAIAWNYLLWRWLTLRTPDEEHPKILKLLILPLMAFPWVTLDAQPVGWWFRLSGAYVTGMIYSILGFDVQVVGTNILIDQLPISVEAACSGLNTLQSMLIAGSLIAFLYLGETNRYWWNLPVLVGMAWLANTVRIILISGIALYAGPEYAIGAFHTWGGWFVLLLMFLLCWGIFSLQEPKITVRPPHLNSAERMTSDSGLKTQGSSWPSWIEIAVIAYCVWQAKDLPMDWYSTPSMRWAWIAFILWTVPIVWHLFTSVRSRLPKGSNPLFLALAIVSTLIGSIGSLHSLQYIGLAFALAALLPLSWMVLLWLISAIAWMPAFGWLTRLYSVSEAFLMEMGIALIGTCLLFAWQKQRRL